MSTSSTQTSRPGRFRRVFTASRVLRYTLPGAWAAWIFAALAFTPSLLPRSGLFQGVLSGINGAIGYGVGVSLAWVWREYADRERRRPGVNSWRLFWVFAIVTGVVAVVLGERWQSQVRELMGAGDVSISRFIMMPVVGVVTFVVLVGVGRALRSAYRGLSSLLARKIGPRAARATGWLAVAVATFLVLSGLVYDNAIKAVDASFSLGDQTISSRLTAPELATRSGSDVSLVDWEDLGRQGRRFVVGGPSAEQITEATGRPAVEPVRAYVGTAAAEDVDERAQLAVDELERAGGFDREYLMVANTTGSGFLEPGAVDSFEYITANSAIISMQYSYLPSWISYLVDQKNARDAGRALFDAVYQRWSALPKESRPKIYIFGESLGSFGGETAFSGEADLANRSSGALFVGPPNFNTLFREFTDQRDAGSGEVEPVFRHGRIVRFSNDATQPAEPVDQPWDGPHVLYLLHPSDPITWWSPDLIWSKPDWLSEPRGRDVLPSMRWIPFVTFWQTAADMAVSQNVPTGHGHTYVGDHVNGWAQVLQLDGWTAEQTQRVRDVILDGFDPDGPPPSLTEE
ncbi:alpha/beta hydrolase [Aeromicrobium sp. P5_D10]